MLGSTLSPKSSASRSSLHSTPSLSARSRPARSMHSHYEEHEHEDPHHPPASHHSPRAPLPQTFTPAAALPASLREKHSTRKALKLPVVSTVVDAILQSFRLEIVNLYLHEPNDAGFHVDLNIRFIGTGPLKAKVFFPNGVSLKFHLPSHEQFQASARAASYTPAAAAAGGEPSSSAAPAAAPADARTQGAKHLSPSTNASVSNGHGLVASPSFDSISPATAGRGSERHPSAPSTATNTTRTRSRLGPSRSTKKLQTSASTGTLASARTQRISYLADLHPDLEAANGNAPAARGRPKHNNGDLGMGQLYTIQAHLEPVKVKPLGEVSARIRIEAEGQGRNAVSALVTKVLRTHGTVKAVLSAEGIFIKAYGLKVAGRPIEKDIAFEGLSHFTNVFRYHKPSHPLALAASESRDSRRQHSGMRAGSAPSTTHDAASSSAASSGLPPPPPSHGRSAEPFSPCVTEVRDLKILEGTPERGIRFSAVFTIPNPSNITVDLTYLELDLCVSAASLRDAGERAPNLALDAALDLIPIGLVFIEPNRLHTGDNVLEVTGFLTLPTLPPGTHPSSQLATIHMAGKHFLAGLLENKPMELIVAAPGLASVPPVLNPSRPLLPFAPDRRVTRLPWLADALEGVLIRAVLPPLGDRVRLVDAAEFRFEIPGGPSPVPRPVARTALRQGLGLDMTVLSLKVDCIAEVPVVPRPGAKAGSGATSGDSASSRLRSHSGAGRGENGSASAGGRGGGGPKPASTIASADGSSASGPSSEKAQPTSGGGGGGGGPKRHSVRVATVQTVSGEAPPILLPASGEKVHQILPIVLNPDLPALIDIVRGHALLRGVDLGPTLTKVLDTFLSGVASLPEAVPADDPWADLASLFARVLEGLHVRAVVEVEIAIDRFRIPGLFRFEIADLPVLVSAQTASSLIPHVANPVVADIMQRMTLQLDNFVVNELSVHGIHAISDVRLLNFGPMRSEVRFREGLELMLQIDGKWTRCGTALIADMVTVDPFAPEPVQSDVFVVPLAGQAGGEAFAKFVEALLQEQSFSVFLAANQFSVRTGGINFLTPIYKAIALEGMNGLHGLSVDDIEILGEVPSPADAFRDPNQKDALRIKFKINIPNQSSINLALARITLYMMFEGVCVGDLEVDEIQLRGKHVTHADGLGTIYIGADDQHETRKAVVLEKIGKLFSLFVAGQGVPLEVRGRRSWAYAPGMARIAMGLAPPVPGIRDASSRMVRQSQRIPWLDAAVRTICLPVTVTLPEPLMIVKQIDIGDVSAEFAEGQPPRLGLKDIDAIYELPYSISLQILSLSLELELLYRGSVLGSVKTEEASATDCEQWPIPPRDTQPAGVGGRIKMNLDSFTLQPDVDSAALSEAIAIVADQDEATHLQVRGMARVRAKTALGTVLAEIQLGEEHTVSVRGLRGLRSRPLQHELLFAKSAAKDHISLRFPLLLYNPSPRVSFHVVAPEVSFAAFYKQHYVGRAIIRKELNLNIGECRAEDVEFRYEPSPESRPHVAAVPENLLSGRITELWIQGDERSTTIPTLLKALQTIRLPFLLQPLLNKTLIGSIATRLSVGMLTSQTCLVEFSVNNPLGVPINILDLEFEATHRGEAFATCSTSFRLPASADGIARSSLSVPAGTPGTVGQQTSPPVETQMAKRIDKMVGTLIAEKGLLYLDIQLKAHVDLGTPGDAFPVLISYSQSGLPLKIRGLPGLG